MIFHFNSFSLPFLPPPFLPSFLSPSLPSFLPSLKKIFKRQSYTKKREWERCSIFWFTPNDHNGQGFNRPEPGAWNFFQGLRLILLSPYISGSWIHSKTDAYMGYWHHRWQFYLQCHNAGPGSFLKEMQWLRWLLTAKKKGK